MRYLVLGGMQTHMCLEAATVPAVQVQASTLATLRAYPQIMSTDEYLAR